MSGGVERTKRVRGENNGSLHQVQLHGRDVNLDNKTGGAALVWGFFSPSLEETAVLPITTTRRKI